MIEPLRRIDVTHGASELDSVVGVEQLGADDSDIVVAACCVLQGREPSGLRDHVGIEDDYVVVGPGFTKPTVDICSKAGVLAPLNHFDALEPP